MAMIVIFILFLAFVLTMVCYTNGKKSKNKKENNDQEFVFQEDKNKKATKEESAKYDYNYIDTTLKSMGYTPSEEYENQYYKVINDKSTFYFDLSDIGLIPSWWIDGETYVLPDYVEDDVEQKISQFIEQENIQKIELSFIAPDAIELLVPPEETIDMYILEKAELILEEIVKVVEPLIITCEEYYGDEE